VSFVKSINVHDFDLISFLSYKHAIDGLWRVYTEEGFARLFSGCSTATSRAIFMTIGQLSFYDQVKKMLLESGYFKDNLVLHFTASSIAGAIATCKNIW
jgi:solute carrier family 25 (mitochondrial dicarboxylate transporter), member 10